MPVPSVSLRKKVRERRDEIVLANLPLVKVIAIRVHDNLPVHVELEDLVHAGVLGLFDAVEKYDGAKQVEFHSYAKHRIRGAILDSLRQQDWASRDLRRRQRQVETVTRELAVKLGRTPTGMEIADSIGVTPDRWHRIAFELRTTTAFSASARPDLEFEHEQEFPAEPDVQPDRICERRQLTNTLQRAIGKLPTRYQKVVFLYYTNQMTMREIGDVLGVNESRVSQIHKMALRRMAVQLKSEGIESAQAI